MAADGRQHTVLTCDDSSTLRQLLRSVLEASGFEVLEVDSGGGSLITLRRLPVDLVIMDINMRGLNGIQTIAAIRAIPKFQDLPIIVLTSEATTVVVQRSRAVGANAIMVKPFDSEKLVGAIHTLIARRENAPDAAP